MTIYTPTKEEMVKFRDAAAKSWPAAEKVMGTERYSKLLKVIEEAEKK
jgi:hypothetical protein